MATPAAAAATLLVRKILSRGLKTTVPSSAEAAAAAGVGVKEAGDKSRARRKKNLVEVVQFLPNWGVGAKLAKGHWQPGTFYQLTRLQLGKDGRHGAAWGVFHASGAPKTGAEEKIGGVNKRVWKYLKEEEQTWKRL